MRFYCVGMSALIECSADRLAFGARIGSPSPSMPTVQVPLGNRSYEIQVGTRLIATLGERCRRLKIGTRCAVITDTNASKHYG